MTTRILFLLAACAAVLPAQLQLSAVVDGQERAVGTIYSIGSVAVDTTLEVRFRVRNTGATLAQIQTISISGAGFQLFQEPSPLPVSLLPTTSVDFFVRFRSSQASTEGRATLRLNTGSVTLLASTTAVVPARLYVIEDDGSRTLRTTELTTVFPTIDRGATATKKFMIENPGTASISLTPFAITGDSFQFAAAQSAPLILAARETKTVDVVFRPTITGLKRATFDLGTARYTLEGVAREPVMPKPTISLERTTLESAKQSKVAVKFDAAARGDGTGELKLEFKPAAGGKDDSAVQFLPDNKRTITFQVKTGQSAAVFGTAQDIVFQTGTTAGSIVFTATMGGWTASGTVAIDPAMVRIDTGRTIRGQDLIDLTLSGFDNTRSVTEVAFTFYDADGAIIAPGAVRANVETRFKDFFDTSTAGGLFSLRAAFPVTGSIAVIRAVEAEFRNRIGVQKTQRFSF